MEIKKLVVSGSIAYDYIMNFSGDFIENVNIDPKKRKFHLPLMPESKELRFGGVSGNIGYNLSLLNQPTQLLTSVGRDFRDLGYETFIRNNPYLDFIGTYHEELYSANCYMVNDKHLNQIIIFHAGALAESVQITLSSKGLSSKNVKWFSVSPDNVDAMYKWALECFSLKIPFLFDPGQVLPAFSSNMLEEILPKAQILIGNEFEIELILKKMNITLEDLQQVIKNIIITKGENGSELITNHLSREIPIASANKFVDPTGAGDGYRSGLLFGLMRDLDLLDACRIGAVTSSFVVETIGPQTQVFDLKDVSKRFENTFHEPWQWN